jgi:hypothetical protein
MILLRLAIIESNQDIRKMPALRTLTIAIHPATHRLPGHLHRLALVAGRFQMASGTGSGRRLRSMHWRNSLTTGHGRANRRMLSSFLAPFSVTRTAILDQVAVNAPVESDDVSSCFGIPPRCGASHSKRMLSEGSWLHAHGLHRRLSPGSASERQRLDRGRYRSRKIASFQRGREPSLRHSADS